MSVDGFPKFTIPFDQKLPIDLGVGVNLLTAKAKSETAFASIALLTGDMVPAPLEQRHYVCATQNEYKEKQDFNLRVDGSKDSLNLGAGIQLLMEKTVTNKSTLCLSVGSVLNRTDSYDPSVVRLSDLAKEVLTRNPEEFVNRFGTHFIGGYLLGATFFSRISIESMSSEDKKKVLATLSGGYKDALASAADQPVAKKAKKKKTNEKPDASRGGGAGTQGSGSFGYEFEKVVTATESRVEAVYLASGLAERMPIDDIEAVANAFADFAVNAQKHPARLMAMCVPYTMLPEVGRIMEQCHPGRGLVPDIDATLVEAICREFLDATRVGIEIKDYSGIAENRIALADINNKYLNKINAVIGRFKNLSIADLAKPSDELLKITGLRGEAHSEAGQIREDWQEAFRAAYLNII